MAEKAGSYSFGYDGTESYVEAEVPDGTTMKLIEAMKSLPPPEPYFLVSTKVLELLRKG